MLFNDMVDQLTVRRCGECNLCCTLLEVFDLPDKTPKPMGCRCKHMTDAGKCGIYETRPETCRVFYCSWRLSEYLHLGIPDKLQPERCGFVLHYDKLRSHLMTLFLDPDRPKAWLPHKRALEKLALRNNCAIVIGGGKEATHYVTPRGTWIAKADFPQYFMDGEVGVQRSEFLPRGA